MTPAASISEEETPMSFEKANDIYLTREWRGPTVFACHWSGWSFPDKWSNFANSWLDIPVPVPPEAKNVCLMGMFVGGVLPGKEGFFMHLDFTDPVPTDALPNGGDWSGNGGQGDFYYYFDVPNARAPFGTIWVPVRDQKIKLRWKIDDAQGYDNAWGINLWCQGYST
jgi:hypothetical protein